MCKCDLLSSTDSCPLTRSVQQWLISLFIPDHCQMRSESIPAVSGGMNTLWTVHRSHTPVTHTHTHTKKQFRVSGQAGEKPLQPLENMQIQYRNARAWTYPEIMSDRADQWTSIPVHHGYISAGAPPATGLWNGIVTYLSSSLHEMGRCLLVSTDLLWFYFSTLFLIFSKFPASCIHGAISRISHGAVIMEGSFLYLI